MKRVLSILIALVFVISFLPNQNTNAKSNEIIASEVKQNNKTASMKVHFIDVGQGDATLIQLATGKNVLVDGGPISAGDKVVAYLNSLKIKKLDYVIATHPDADHIGALIDVLNNFTVTNFINSGKEHTTETYYDLLALVNSKKIKYIEPELGAVYEYNTLIESYFQILYVNPKANDNNDASIVVKTGLGNNEFLLAADAGTDIENKLIKTYDTIKATVLKAGHHGSSTSSSLSFLKAVKPEIAILSYGKNNNYGHPHKEVLANIKKVGAKVYSTVEGTIIVTTNGKKYSVNTLPSPIEVEKEPEPKESYKNCTELQKVYPNGVKKGHSAYDTKHDRDNDGWACEPDVDNTPSQPTTPTTTPTNTSPTPPSPTPTKAYKNCTELKKDYPNGVSSSHPAYQSKMDRDNDGWACE